MEACAAKWVKEIREKEQPDILIGLFHSGMDGKKLDNVVENGSKGVAANVPGFDVVFMGHLVDGLIVAFKVVFKRIDQVYRFIKNSFIPAAVHQQSLCPEHFRHFCENRSTAAGDEQIGKSTNCRICSDSG